MFEKQRHAIATIVHRYGLFIAALALCQTWSYTTFFSGFLIGYCTRTECLPESYWSFSELGIAFIAFVLLVVWTRRTRAERGGREAGRAFSRGGNNRADGLVFLSAAGMFLGVLAVWSSFHVAENNTLLYGIGGFVAGCGMGYMLVSAYPILMGYPSGHLYQSIAISFALSFVLYLVLLPLPSLVVLTIVEIMPFALAGIVFYLLSRLPIRSGEDDGTSEDASACDRDEGEGSREGASFGSDETERSCGGVVSDGYEAALEAKGHDALFAVPMPAFRFSARVKCLVFFIWLNFAFCRFVASPWHLATQPWYYFAMFITVLVVCVASTVLIVRSSHHANLNLPRLIVLGLCVSYAILYIDFTNEIGGIVALYTVLICLIIWEMFVIKFMLDMRFSGKPIGTPYVLAYMIAAGLGVFAGIQSGFIACHLSSGNIPPTVPLVMLTVLFGIATSVRLPDSAPQSGASGDASLVPEVSSAVVGPVADELSGAQVDESVERMSGKYGLSRREVDILRLLLCGRSRPFISKALYLSMGTVNTHISSLYRKVGVRSKQELITLAAQGIPSERG